MRVFQVRRQSYASSGRLLSDLLSACSPSSLLTGQFDASSESTPTLIFRSMLNDAGFSRGGYFTQRTDQLTNDVLRWDDDESATQKPFVVECAVGRFFKRVDSQVKKQRSTQNLVDMTNNRFRIFRSLLSGKNAWIPVFDAWFTQQLRNLPAAIFERLDADVSRRRSTGIQEAVRWPRSATRL